jgi:hypothetical protein
MIFFNKNKSLEIRQSLKTECLSDMDTGGIRFTESQIQKIKEDTEKLQCNYSGLPSVYAYQ